LLAFALNPGKVVAFSSMRVSILLDLIDLLAVLHNHARRNCLCIVRFANSWEVENEFHLLTSNIIDLRTLCKLRPSWQEAVLCNLIISNHILSMWFLCRTTRYAQVTYRIISGNPVEYLEVFHIPLHNLRRNE